MFISLSIITVVELLCFILGLITLLGDKKPLWRNTLIFLLIVCLTEVILGRWAARKFHNNIFIYNIYTLFEAGFISAGIYQCLKKYINPTKIITIGLVIFYVTYIAFFVTHGISPYNTWAASILAVIFVLYCLYYYYLVISADELMEINTSPEFWWMTAVLFFYFGSTTGNLFHELFTSIVIGKFSIRGHLFNVLNVIFYSLWAYSFICRIKQRRLQS
ncbi:MAG: hypothetical protein ABWZ79_16985 [Pedobacter agri]|uniref:Uncharacterized protein n=1 Tax=Pedobacter agri TaxID=454586 RepID=A0A9X3DEH8_9SPHI|nr:MULTISPECIES: hypothetical protein [Pedobacter]AZI24511.1 hypothetical protein EA772_03805 [Pedobacter sp. G11]MCX3265700.1 hypothetical protein [Pedobacter agri]